jgi:hypothetical protein
VREVQIPYSAQAQGERKNGLRSMVFSVVSGYAQMQCIGSARTRRIAPSVIPCE